MFFGRYPGSTGPEVGSLSLHPAQIMTHLGIQHVPDQRDEPAAASAASLDVLAAAATATDLPPPQQ